MNQRYYKIVRPNGSNIVTSSNNPVLNILLRRAMARYRPEFHLDGKGNGGNEDELLEGRGEGGLEEAGVSDQMPQAPHVSKAELAGGLPTQDSVLPKREQDSLLEAAASARRHPTGILQTAMMTDLQLQRQLNNPPVKREAGDENENKKPTKRIKVSSPFDFI